MSRRDDRYRQGRKGIVVGRAAPGRNALGVGAGSLRVPYEHPDESARDAEVAVMAGAARAEARRRADSQPPPPPRPRAAVEPRCGAAFTITAGNVAVCTRKVSEHAGLDHHDPAHGVSWPLCASSCEVSGHICGRYRGDTAAGLDGSGS